MWHELYLVVCLAVRPHFCIRSPALSHVLTIEQFLFCDARPEWSWYGSVLLHFLFHFASAFIATTLSGEYGSPSSAGLDHGHDGTLWLMRFMSDRCFTAELMMLLLAADRLQRWVGACIRHGLSCGDLTGNRILISLQTREVLEDVAIFSEMGMKMLLLCAYYLTAYNHWHTVMLFFVNLICLVSSAIEMLAKHFLQNVLCLCLNWLFYELLSPARMIVPCQNCLFEWFVIYCCHSTCKLFLAVYILTVI